MQHSMTIKNLKNKVEIDLQRWLDTYNEQPITDGGAPSRQYCKGRVDAYCEIKILLQKMNHESE